MGENLWLLANQLYWPTTPSVIPALGFGFAVDGGGCVIENLFTRFRSIPKRSIPKKCHSGQAFALLEGTPPDAGDAIRDRDARQAGAPREGTLPDAGDTVRDGDAGQAIAS